MLDFLFRGLTADQAGTALFDALTREARQPHWYAEGTVPDTLDGRFAALATVVALCAVRLEREGETGDRASVALTERFIAVMESEHREFGLGDPTLGKTVRKLVRSLARRTGVWRAAVTRELDWTEATRESLYGGGVSPEGLRHSAEALERLWQRLGRSDLHQLEQGKLQ
jgi:cytochrome b pre-mRNA-processing protein 3